MSGDGSRSSPNFILDGHITSAFAICYTSCPMESSGQGELAEATVEDLAFPSRSSREPHEVVAPSMSEHAKFNRGGPKEGMGLSGLAYDDHAELRRRREGRGRNGVKNLNGSKANLLGRKKLGELLRWFSLRTVPILLTILTKIIHLSSRGA